MNLNTAAGVLRTLPPSIRKTLYTVLGVVGAALAVLVGFDVEKIGPLSVDTMLQVCTVLPPLMGVVAVANVTPGEGDELSLLDFDEDCDASSFEPVGDESDVFAEALS
ncbi:hypothetical protein [Nocardioides sp.]|uniref:hypothetical protein n=1 Tax=Nocardioides sp. TaxID=35761 RepID=UPI0035B0F93E